MCVTSSSLSLPGQAGGSISEGFVHWRVCGGLEEYNGFDEDAPGELVGNKSIPPTLLHVQAEIAGFSYDIRAMRSTTI